MINVSSIKRLKSEESPATEPAVNVGIAVTSVASIVGIISYFLPGMSNDVVQIIAVIVVLLLPVITGLITRGRVWSPASVKTALEVLEGLVKFETEQHFKSSLIKERIANPAIPDQVYVEGTEKRPSKYEVEEKDI